MDGRRRFITGIGLALAVGLFGPSLAAVATHTGNGYQAIRGTVTNEDGAPIEGICVVAYHRSYILFDEVVLPGDPAGLYPEASRTTTLADGTYVLGRLTNDNWRVKFEQCQVPVRDRTYMNEWYDDAHTSAAATLVKTQYGMDAFGIDAVLSRRLP